LCLTDHLPGSFGGARWKTEVSTIHDFFLGSGAIGQGLKDKTLVCAGSIARMTASPATEVRRRRLARLRVFGHFRHMFSRTNAEYFSKKNEKVPTGVACNSGHPPVRAGVIRSPRNAC
jgi:hypothetical protein